MDTLRYALRSLRRTPGFAIAAALVLAIGIGANATMFGVVDTLLLRPPPLVVEPDRVTRYYVRQSDPAFGEFTNTSVSYPEYADLRDNGRDFSAVAAFAPVRVPYGRGASARELRAVFATRSFFGLLGVRPALGRFFTPEEDDPAKPVRVAVLDHGLWRREFGSDPAVLGKQLQLGDAQYTVVGVAPKGFTGVDISPVDVWIPMAAAEPLAASAESFTSRNWQWLQIVGRLRPGATAEAAALAATAIRRHAQEEARRAAPPNRQTRRVALGGRGGPRGDDDALVILGPVVRDRGPDPSRAATVSLWLGGVAVVVLLIACANVANLLLVRALRRRREIAVRVALGISRTRLALQLGAESLVLSAAGAVLGIGVAVVGSRIVQRVLLADAGDIPLQLNGRVLLFTGVAAAVTALVCGLVPALQASAPDITGALKAGAREGGAAGHRRLRDGLVVAQVALTIVLLVGAGLFVRSLRHAVTLDMGIEPQGLVVANMDLREAGYDRRESDALFRRMLERIEALPEVQGATLAVATPFRSMFSQRLRIPGRDSLPRPAEGGGPYFNGVTASYFPTMGLALQRGRLLTEGDVGSRAPVMVINDALARLYWPGQDPVGQCMIAGRDSTGPCRTVVGVVENAKMNELREQAVPQLYMPLPAGDTLLPPMRVLFVRARAGGPEAAERLIPVVRRAMQSVAPDLPYANVSAFAELYDPQVRPWRLGATMFSLFGGAALLLAVVGLYAVLAYSVSQRTHEIGVRLALGAQAGDVQRLVVAQGVRVALVGLAVGAVGAWVGGRFVRDQLFGVSAHDPAVFAAVAVTLLVVAGVASWVPARRASRTDPLEALQAE